ELLPLFVLNRPALQSFQIKPDRGNRRLELVSDGVKKAVLLLVAPHFAYQKDGVQNHAHDNDGEEDNSQHEWDDFAPVKDDPADVEYGRDPGDENAERNEERDRGGAAGDAHELQEEDSIALSQCQKSR